MEDQIKYKDILDNLILDYLTRTISCEDKRRLTERIKESDKDSLYFRQQIELWGSSKVIGKTLLFDHEEAYTLFKARTESKPHQDNKQLQLLPLIKYAAILIPFLFLGYFTVLYFKMQHTGKDEVPLYTISTPLGSKTNLKLADGTDIWLNSGTTIECAPGFGKRDRTLSLTGEAYFEVAKNDLPFTINTGNLHVEVVGTHFNVKAYTEDNEASVTLLEGLLNLTDSDKNKLVHLQPMETAVYTAGNLIVRKDSSATIDWMNNHIIFKGETFAQIIRVLQRNFNIKIHIHNESIKERRFAGEFTENENIEQIFRIMSASEKFRYTIKGTDIDVF